MSMERHTTADAAQCWKDIDYSKAKRYVKKLQKRIAAAWHNDDIEKVDILQHMLVHSYYAKALAVNVVASSDGKNTPGVDGVIWDSPDAKYEAIGQLRRRGYRPSSLKRVYIPKPNGGHRPLSIPTMKDRAMQTLFRFTIEPIGWVTADPSSFAYLPGRSARSAIIKLGGLLADQESRWIMKADIKACFDNISHEWVLEHIPMDKVVLRKFLKCGYIENEIYYPTEQGVPQGGPISSVICNMVLDGLENLLAEQFGTSVHLIRYADDILIVGEDHSLLVRAVTPAINDFLYERGLSLSNEKTGYYSVYEKVCFLGYEIHKEGGEYIANPSRKSMDALLEKVAFICIETELSPESKRNQLKQQIRGWLSYFAGIIPVQSFLGAEFDVAFLIQKLTGDKLLADDIGKIFAQYEKFYI